MSAPKAPAKPAILSVDDDPGVSRAVVRDLRKRYGEKYRIIRAESGDQALEWGTEDAGGEVPMEFTALKPLPADIAVNPKYATGKVIYQGDVAEPS